MNLRRTIAGMIYREDLATIAPEPNAEQRRLEAKEKLAALVAAALPAGQRYARNRAAQTRKGREA